MQAFEDWTFVEANYFCFVSLMTIGFGDYYPGMKTLDKTEGKVRALVQPSRHRALGVACCVHCR